MKSLDSLNKVAADTQTVFLYLPEQGKKIDKATQKKIDNAAEKVRAEKMKVACYSLDPKSSDYSDVTTDIPAPCILILVKAKGMSVLKKEEFTEAKLAEAYKLALNAPHGCGCTGYGFSSAGAANMQ